MNEKTLVTNSPNGDLIRHTVSLTDKKLTCTIIHDTFKEKLIFNFALNREAQHLWSVSLKRSIVCSNFNDPEKTLMWNSTLAEKLYTIRESPHDMNKFAVAGKTRSVYILDASNFSPHNMKTVVYANRIKANVISVAWHPASENLLAFNPKYLCEDKPISTVAAGKKWLSVGSQDGYVYILNLNGLEVKCSSNVSNRYVCDCAWNPINQDVLAASADTPDIHLFDCSNGDNGEMRPIGVLKGHCKGGVTSIKWSNEDEHKLLSTGFDGTVRIWNAKTRGPTFCATFWPKDENFVICSGYNESLYMFDTRNRMDEWNAKPIKEKPDDIKWAMVELTGTQQLLSMEKKVNRKSARKFRRNEMSQLTDGLKDIELEKKPTETIKQPMVNMELNHTTVLYLSNKEFNKNGIEILNEMIFEQQNDDVNNQSNRSLHRLLFAGKDEAKQLLDIELQNHKNSTTDSIGHVFIPQLNFNLEAEFNELIATERLMPQHVSPMISFSFWRKCCKSLASQYLEKSYTLLAIPYLLAVHEINDVIKHLTDANFYREAWIVAKVHKEPEDQIFSDIASSWTTYLEDHGNLDGAALVAYSAGKTGMAAALLSKKRTKSENVEKIIEILNE